MNNLKSNNIIPRYTHNSRNYYSNRYKTELNYQSRSKSRSSSASNSKIDLVKFYSNGVFFTR